MSFDQFPIKSGILPVSRVSEAHLRTTKVLVKEDLIQSILENSILWIYISQNALTI